MVEVWLVFQQHIKPQPGVLYLLLYLLRAVNIRAVQCGPDPINGRISQDLVHLGADSLRMA